MAQSTERMALTEAVYYILLSLRYPLHGYAIMQKVREMSRGRVDLGAGTLYGAIGVLADKGWIVPSGGEEDSRRKAYVITGEGRQALAWEIERLEELIENGRKFSGNQGENEE